MPTWIAKCACQADAKARAVLATSPLLGLVCVGEGETDLAGPPTFPVSPLVGLLGRRWHFCDFRRVRQSFRETNLPGRWPQSCYDADCAAYEVHLLACTLQSSPLVRALVAKASLGSYCSGVGMIVADCNVAVPSVALGGRVPVRLDPNVLHDVSSARREERNLACRGVQPRVPTRFRRTSLSVRHYVPTVAKQTRRPV